VALGTGARYAAEDNAIAKQGIVKAVPAADVNRCRKST